MHRAFLCLATLSLFVGCGDLIWDSPHEAEPGEGTGDVVVGFFDPAIVEYCEVERLRCERQIECGRIVVNNSETLEGCLATLDECELSIAQVVALGNTVDMDDLALCREFVEQANCSELRWQAEPSCSGSLDGTGDVGDDCRGGFPEDGCREGLHCEFSDQTCPGTCSPPCTSALDCGEGMYCEWSGQCLPRQELGATCDGPDSEACLDGLVCGRDESTDNPNSFVCIEALQPGDPCDTGIDCVDGYRCSFETGLCEPSLSLGGECFDFWACGDGLVCDFLVGECVIAPQLNEACSSYRACAPNLECLLPTEGECTSDTDCFEQSDFDQPSICCVVDDTAQCVSWDASDDTLSQCQPPGVCVEEGTGQSDSIFDYPDDVIILSPGDSCANGGLCPLGTRCQCPEGSTCTEAFCLEGFSLGESCAPHYLELEPPAQGIVMITETLFSAFDPRVCQEGMCDVFASYTCVDPAEAGAPCSYTELTATAECRSFFCLEQQCLSFEDLSCPE